MDWAAYFLRRQLSPKLKPEVDRVDALSSLSLARERCLLIGPHYIHFKSFIAGMKACEKSSAPVNALRYHDRHWPANTHKCSWKLMWKPITGCSEYLMRERLAFVINSSYCNCWKCIGLVGLMKANRALSQSTGAAHYGLWSLSDNAYDMGY